VRARVEGPNHLSLPRRQRPPYGKAAEVSRARDNDHVNCIAGECVTGLGIEGWLPTHVQLIATMGRLLSLSRSANRRMSFDPTKVRFGSLADITARFAFMSALPRIATFISAEKCQ
jgi:hypothetical protein